MSEDLAKVFKLRRKYPVNTTFVNPNSITVEYKAKPFKNKDIVIGYFGGSSHYQDLHETGVAEALEKLMNEDKSIRFKAVGMPLDKYVPRKRYEFVDGKRGDGWLYELYPNLAMDIALAPLHDNIFNRGKSNIKWQEATRAGACLVASNIGPYSHLKPGVAKLVDNDSDSWYKALKQLVNDKQEREQLLANAQAELAENWTLEKNWTYYRDMFNKVKDFKNANYNTNK